MTMNLKHSFIIVNTFKRRDGNIEKTVFSVYDYGNKKCFSRSPFAISIHFIGKITTNKYAKLTVWRMKEYYAVDGSMSELFLAAESDFVSGSDNRVEETELKNIFTPS